MHGGLFMGSPRYQRSLWKGNWMTMGASCAHGMVPLAAHERHRPMLSEFLLAEMNRLGTQDALPLHRQLYEALRRAMLDGKLGAGERLPSSRDLAQDLNLSRNTVVAPSISSAWKATWPAAWAAAPT
jgi:hypothetical protein